MLRHFVLFVSIFITACQSVTREVIPTQTNTPSVTVTATPTLVHLLSKSNSWSYKIIYQDGNFAIREINLGHIDWSTFVMPPSRIGNTVTDFNPGIQYDTGWCENLKSSGNCSKIINIEKTNHQSDIYEFQCNFGLMVRTCKLLKNKKLIWSGDMNGGASDPVDSIREIGGEIALSYMASDNSSKSSQIYITPSIIITNENAFSEIKNAFAPNEILGRLTYFLNRNSNVVLVFDNKEVGEYYDRIFNTRCCWDGPSIQIASNGQIIDFFALKGNDWYHVQAGDATYLASLSAEGK